MSERNFNDSDFETQESKNELSADNGYSAGAPSDSTPMAVNAGDFAENQKQSETDALAEAPEIDGSDEAEFSFDAAHCEPEKNFSEPPASQYSAGQVPQAPSQEQNISSPSGYGATSNQGASQPAQGPSFYNPQGSYTPPIQPDRPAAAPPPWGAPSQGYFHPQTNEFVYSPEAPKKKGSFGKGLIITIACVLSAFIISILSISAYTYFTGGYSLRSPYADSRGNAIDPDERQKVDQDIHAFKNETDDEGGDDIEQIDEADKNSSDTQEAVNAPEKIREFPTIQQLATPDDAMMLPDIYDKVSKSVVGVSTLVRGGTQTGTGFIISEDGYIVTNAHVIEDYISVMIVDGDSNEYEATVIGSDEQTDIAVLKVNPGTIDLVPVEFGKSGDLRIGEIAVAIGNPLGFELYGTMTTGIISGLDRTITVGDNTMNLLQTSASINSGNSGGPLINAYGMVVGITSAKVNSLYGESLGFAIPIDEALPIVESLIAYGYVPGRPSLGITCETIDDIVSMYYRLPKGVYVRFVTPNGAAAKAGITSGDIIIGIEGESVENPDELNEVKNRYSVGDTVTLTVYRSGQSFDIDVVLSETTPDN